MKKTLFWSSFATLLIIVPFAVSAFESDIDPLGNNSADLVCINLTQDLRVMSRDSNTAGQVSDLQFFLQSKGYLDSEPTGYFGNLTLRAVKSFQRDHEVNPSGFVGSLTRGKINAASCNIPIINNDNNNVVINRNVDNFGAIRFVAPDSDTYQVSATLAPILKGSMSQDSDFHVVQSNLEIYKKDFAANETGSFSRSVNLKKGENLDFLVGRGPDGKNWGSGLVISLSITGSTGSYNIGSDFPDTLNPKGVWTIGYKPIMLGGFVPFVNTYMVPDDNRQMVKSWSVSATEQPSIYWNNSTTDVVANGGASVFPPKSVWFVAGIEGVTLRNNNIIPTYTPSPSPRPYYTPSPSPTPSYSPRPSPSSSYYPSPSPTPTASPVATPLTIIYPKEGSAYYGDDTQSIIILWSKYSGDFDHYEVIAGNTTANVEAKISDRPVDRRSNGFRVDVGKLRQVIGSLSNNIAYGGGYYFKVVAVKNDAAGGRVVEIAKSPVFSISKAVVSPSSSPVASPTKSPVPSGVI